MGQWLIQKESETSLIGSQASANKRNKQHRNVVAFVESLKILGFSFYYLQPQCYCHLLEWFDCLPHRQNTHAGCWAILVWASLHFSQSFAFASCRGHVVRGLTHTQRISVEDICVVSETLGVATTRYYSLSNWFDQWWGDILQQGNSFESPGGDLCSIRLHRPNHHTTTHHHWPAFDE